MKKSSKINLTFLKGSMCLKRPWRSSRVAVFGPVPPWRHRAAVPILAAIGMAWKAAWKEGKS